MKHADAKRWLVRSMAALAFTGNLAVAQTSHEQTSATPAPAIPDWALPGSATHKQVPPPADFHRPTRTELLPIGIFSGQSDVGAPLVAGSSTFDPATGRYTIHSAGYNLWYTRDEFRFLWKQMSGDVSLAADVSFPVAAPPSDRKVVLVVRQSLDDDAREAVVAEHGTGMVHLAERTTADTNMTDMTFTFGGSLRKGMAQRIGIEKHGNSVTLYASLTGEPMHALGPPVQVPFTGPFYVGIGFCSHLPATLDTGTFSNVLLVNAAGALR